MTKEELARTAKQIMERNKPQPTMMPVGDTLQSAPNQPPTSLPALVPEPQGDPTTEMGVADRLKKILAGNASALPPRPQNPAVTAIESQLNAMDEPPAAMTLADRARGALRGFGMYGGMNPVQAQQLEANSRQQQFENQQTKRQGLAQQAKDIMARDRQDTQDARQRGLDEQGAELQGVQIQNIQDQIRERNEPKPVATPTPRNIDPLSPEGVAARVQFENQRPKDTPAGARPDYQWVLRNGAPLEIQRGTARPGDRPFDPVAERSTLGANATSPYSAERAKRTKDSVDQLLTKVSRWTVGAGSMLSSLPETDARSFNAELDTLKANIAFNELAAMREASKTGGALGAVSEREMRLLESSLGALDTGQRPEDFTVQLQKIKQSIERWETAQAMQGAPDGGGAKRLKRTSRKTGAVEYSDDGGASWHK